MTTSSMPARAHLITGGFPPGRPAGHDHDYARLRLLEFLYDAGVPCSVGNDFHDVERWLDISRLLITYVAGPYPSDEENRTMAAWLAAGGRWVGLHGTSGGRAARTDSGRRRMVKTSHHMTLGGMFLSHPPVRKFQVDVRDANDVLTRDLPEHFEVIDELYMVELQDPAMTKVLLTTDLPKDPTPEGFGMVYEGDPSLQPDGKSRVLGYTKDVGAGGVTYIALGHCHTPETNSQRMVDTSVDPNGVTPLTLRGPWETDAYPQLLRNAIEWGMGA